MRAWARRAQVPHEGDAQAAQHARALAQAEHVLQLRALARLSARSYLGLGPQIMTCSG